MKNETYHLRIITPCFCAGANQAVAELRPSAIRGQLRWWFRALGGNPQEEAMVFGMVAGDNPKAGNVIVRISNFNRGTNLTMPKLGRFDAETYLLYFASVSANKTRWEPEGNIPPGSTFSLHIQLKKKLPERTEEHFKVALSCFLHFGGTGLRLTRGLGAHHLLPHSSDWKLSFNDTEKFMSSREFHTRRVPLGSPDWLEAVRTYGPQVKSLRKYYVKTKGIFPKPSPLGTSMNPRQTSVVYFRPYLNESENFDLIVFEAPHDRVLGPDTKRHWRSGPILKLKQ